jgi:hypothetical protein
MLKRTLMVSALSTALSLSAGFTWAADPEPAKGMMQEQIYGNQIMTEQERMEYRTKMRTAETAEAREQLRKEHHELMKERAKARGVTLPDEMPARGGGMGPSGSGMGPGGAGPGGGMGGRGRY